MSISEPPGGHTARGEFSLPWGTSGRMTTPHKPAIVPVILFTLTVGVSLCSAGETGFHDVCPWAAFDAGDHGVRDDPHGYDDAVDLGDPAALPGVYGTNRP